MKKDEEVNGMIAELVLLKKSELRSNVLETLINEHFRNPDKEISERNLENIIRLYYRLFRNNPYAVSKGSTVDIYRKGGRRS